MKAPGGKEVKADVPLGRLLNFHGVKLTDGVVHLILPGADRSLGMRL